MFLAPMEDITDPSFRYLCKKFGADVMYTEFISSDGLIRDGAKSVKKLDIFDYERPMGIQLYGHIIESMVEATHRALESKPEIIDINYGCPVRKIAKIRRRRIRPDLLRPGLRPAKGQRKGEATASPFLLQNRAR